MAISGRIGDLEVGEVLLVLAGFGKSGTLTLSRGDGNGLVVLHNGQVVYAAADSVRESIGSILVRRGALTESGLHSAVEAQQHAAKGRPLGSVLIEMRLVSPGDLESALREQLEDALGDLLSWREGTFVFDPQQRGGVASIGLDPRPLLERAGYAPGGDEGTLAAPVATPGMGDTQAIAIIKPLIAEVRSPSFTGEITQKIITCARGVMRRCVFFAVRHEVIAGMAEYGVKSGGAQVAEWVRELKVPRDGESVLAAAAGSGETYRGPLRAGEWDERLRQHLGGGNPAEVVVVPMMVAGRVVVLLYGDNLPGSDPVGPLDDLERLLAEMGRAMDKSALKARMKVRRTDG